MVFISAPSLSETAPFGFLIVLALARGLISRFHIYSDIFLGQVCHKTFQYLRLQATSNRQMRLSEAMRSIRFCTRLCGVSFSYQSSLTWLLSSISSFIKHIQWVLARLPDICPNIGLCGVSLRISDTFIFGHKIGRAHV